MLLNFNFFNLAFIKKDGVPEEFKQVFETANKYHFLHSIALMGVPLCRRPLLVCNVFSFKSYYIVTFLVLCNGSPISNFK